MTVFDFAVESDVLIALHLSVLLESIFNITWNQREEINPTQND